jgi:hypothetical protein
MADPRDPLGNPVMTQHIGSGTESTNPKYRGRDPDQYRYSDNDLNCTLLKKV